ncbi:YtxH-like protein [compost metagenome]
MGRIFGIKKFITGLAIGAGLGVLFAPQEGSETRRQLREQMNKLLAKLKHIDMEEVQDNIEFRIAELKLELEMLDKETAVKIAKDKASKIKEKAEDLLSYTIQNGAFILKENVNAIHEKAIAVTKEVLAKLEKTETTAHQPSNLTVGEKNKKTV